MSSPKPHKVLIHATFATVVSNDDPAEAEMIGRKLFEDDISSKSEMFSTKVGRVVVAPYREQRPVMRTRAEISRTKRRRYRYAWGLWLQGLTLRQVAAYLNVTRSRAEQILHGHVRIMRYRHRLSQKIEGDNWKATASFHPPISDYRVRTYHS